MPTDPPPGNVSRDNDRETGVIDLVRQNQPQFLFRLLLMVLKEILSSPAIGWRRWKIRSHAQQAIGYIGWIGHNNLGDEAMFDAIREALQVEQALIPFIAAEGESMFARIGLGGSDLFRSVLFGGGTLIHPYYLPVARCAQKFRLPLYTVGTGVGSPGFFAPERPSLSGWKDILQDCQLLSVRGPMSYETLRGLGLSHVEIIGDPALGLAPDAPPPYRSRQRLIISLAQEKPPAADSGEYAVYRQVARIANDFIEKGGEVVGVALGGRDREALETFVRDHQVPKLRIEDHRTSAQGFFQTVAGSIGLIGVRLHSAVLACCVGVPPILFAYRDKCKDFMSSMDLGDFAVELSREHGPQRLGECFDRVQAQADLGARIYEKSCFWKQQQQAFYARLAKSIAGLQRS
jgi:polysaccharide pyruvyl transferase WcaK-like protein